MNFSVTFTNNSFNIEWPTAPAIAYPSDIPIWLHNDNIHLTIGATTLNYQNCTSPVYVSGRDMFDGLISMRPHGGGGADVTITNLSNPMPVTVSNPVNAAISGSVTVSNFPNPQATDITNWPTDDDIDIWRVGSSNTAITGSLPVAGPIAHDSPNTTYPVVLAGIATAAPGTLANGVNCRLNITSSAQMVRFPNAPSPWQQFFYADTGGVDVQIQPAPVSGRRTYICTMIVSNGNAGSTTIEIKSGATTIWQTFASTDAPQYGERFIQFVPPLRCNPGDIAYVNFSAIGGWFTFTGFTGY